MNAIVPFSFESTSIRTIYRDNLPWLVGADVCRALGLGNPRQALSRLDEDEKGVTNVDTLGGAQNATIINEPGVYRLIFTSRRPEAERFKRWLAHEVLPELRRTGSYQAAPRRQSFPSSLLSDLFAIFDDHNRGSDWSEYIPTDHLDRAFPTASRSQLKGALGRLGFLPQVFPYMGEAFAFIRYTQKAHTDDEVALPMRWMFDNTGKWRPDAAKLLTR